MSHRALLSVVLAMELTSCVIDDRLTKVEKPSRLGGSGKGTGDGDGGQQACGIFPFDDQVEVGDFFASLPSAIQAPAGVKYLGQAFVNATDTFECVAEAQGDGYRWQWTGRVGTFEHWATNGTPELCGRLSWKPGTVWFDLGDTRILVATPVGHAPPEAIFGGLHPEQDWWLLRVEPPLPPDVPKIGWILQTGKGDWPPDECTIDDQDGTKTGGYSANFDFFSPGVGAAGSPETGK